LFFLSWRKQLLNKPIPRPRCSILFFNLWGLHILTKNTFREQGLNWEPASSWNLEHSKRILRPYGEKGLWLLSNILQQHEIGQGWGVCYVFAISCFTQRNKSLKREYLGPGLG
jgi:hypothetical protein